MDLIEIKEIQKISLELIGKAQTEEAIALLIEFLEERDRELYSQFLLISNQYFATRNKMLLGLGNNEKSFNRINYAIIIFINNLDCNPVKTVKESFKDTNKKSIFVFSTLAGLLTFVFFIYGRQIFNYFVLDNQKNINSTDIQTYKFTDMPDLQTGADRSKIPLIYRSNDLNISDTLNYNINLKLIEVKKDIIEKYNLQEEINKKSSYSYKGMIEEKKWVVKIDEKPILDKDEFLTLGNLVSLRQLHEYDELTLRQDVNLSRISFLEPEISFPKTGTYTIIINDYSSSFLNHFSASFDFGKRDKISSAYLNKFLDLYRESSKNEASSAILFFNNLKELEKNDNYLFVPVKGNYNVVNHRKKNKQEEDYYYFLNKFGLKEEDKIYIITEEEEEEDG